MERLRLEVKYSNRKDRPRKWKRTEIASGVSALDSVQKELAKWEMYLISRGRRLRKTYGKHGKVVDKIGVIDNLDDLLKLPIDDIIAYLVVSFAERDMKEAVENVEYWRKQVPLAQDKLIKKYFGKLWSKKTRKFLGDEEPEVRRDFLNKLKQAGCNEIKD